MSSGFSGPIVFGPEVSNNSYPYRRGTGMVPSAEWSVFMDDFYSFIVATAITNGPVANTPWGWQGAIIDSGATVTLGATAGTCSTGVLIFADATASEGAAIYGTKALQLTAGKRFWMEMRASVNDINDNAIQFGLSSLTATTNPEDLWTTASDTFMAFGLLDGTSAAVTLTADKSNAGPTADVSATSIISSNTYTTYGIYYDGSNLFGYINGALRVGPFSSTSKIPTGIAMAPFIGHLNGDGSGGGTCIVDYIRWCVER